MSEPATHPPGQATRNQYLKGECSCDECRALSNPYQRKYRQAKIQREVQRLCVEAMREHLPDEYEQIKKQAKTNLEARR